MFTVDGVGRNNSIPCSSCFTFTPPSSPGPSTPFGRSNRLYRQQSCPEGEETVLLSYLFRTPVPRAPDSLRNTVESETRVGSPSVYVRVSLKKKLPLIRSIFFFVSFPLFCNRPFCALGSRIPREDRDFRASFEPIELSSVAREVTPTIVLRSRSIIYDKC